MIKVSQFIALFVAAILAVLGTASAQQDLRVGLLDAEPCVSRIGTKWAVGI
jgi:hypothetical protein